MWSKEKKYGARMVSEKSFESIERKRIKESQIHEESEETKIRREIHNFIFAKVYEGRSKEDILKRVRFVFGATRYQPYWKFFEKWVESAYGKRENLQKKPEESEIEK